MRTAMMLLCNLATVGLATAAPEMLVPAGEFVPTKLPFTYILDYNDAAYFGGSYAAVYEVGPPELLHMGTVTPSHSYFGPAHSAKAALGQEPFPSIETFVQQYQERLQKAKQANDELRRLGVGKVVAYVCMMTTGGDPDKRTGFWHFYDNWEAFAPLGAGPKPADDPVLWQQRKPDGSEHHYYTKEHYMPMFFRYSNCVNNPNWQQYMKWVIRGAAEAGFDGVFVDNAGSMRCYCKYCTEGFGRYLRSRYTEAEVRELFADDLSLSADLKGLRGAETFGFWGESIHDFHDLIRREGSAVRGSFYLFPNGLQGRPGNVQGMFRDCDLAMAENSVGTYGTHPGRTRGHVIAGIYVSHINDNIFAHKVSAAAGAPCRSGLLTRPGYPKRDPAFEMNPRAAELGLAEAAAFSGGGCFLHDPPTSHPEFGPARAQYNAFFRGHRDWYEGYYPYGTAGVLTMFAQSLLGDQRHVTAAAALVEQLLAQHVLADPVPERVVGTDLSRYEYLIVPPVANLPEVWMEKLKAYQKAGGKLLIDQAPETAALDQIGRTRPAAAVAELKALAAALPADVSLIAGEGGPLRGARMLEEEKGEAVRVAAYVDAPVAPRRMTVHLVNYAVSLGMKADQVDEVRDLRVAVPLPAGRTARAVRIAAPSEEDAVLPVRVEGAKATFTIPRLSIYAVCLLELQGR